jgi:xylan 1,4-beta-xylosidase
VVTYYATPMKFMLPLLLITVTFAAGSFAQKPLPGPEVTYRNPVIAGDFADPSVILVGDTYYAAGTSSEWGPAYPIYSSKNLIDWEYVGPVFRELPVWTMGSYWAPELYYRNGTYYCYYTARRKYDKQSFIGVATTTDLKKGFKDHGVILEWTKEAIDAFVAEDKGKLYITWKAYGLDKDKGIEILGAELSPDGLQVTGKEFTLIKADPAGWEGGGVEGQSIFRRGNFWYMLYSGNACCGAGCDYQVGFARAERLQGPWTKFEGNPALFGDETWKCPGHGTVVITQDNRYFYLHHAYNAVDLTFVGRQGVLSELVWNETTEWPFFRYGRTTPAQAQSPAGLRTVINPNFIVDYERDTTITPWTYDVSLPKPLYAVRNGALLIENTSSAYVGNFLGLTVKKGGYSFMAEVIAKKELLQSIVVYGDASNAIGYGVTEHYIELWQVKDGAREVLKRQEIPEKYNDIELKLHTRFGRFYEFSWGIKGHKIDSLSSSVQIEAPWLPRWDRAPRVGVNVFGNGEGKAEIKAVQMMYE